MPSRSRYACLLILTLTGLLEAQEGAALYGERCASCHDSDAAGQPQGRIPSIATIKRMTGQAVYAALTNGAMKSQTAGLSTQQVLSLLVYIAPTGDADKKPAFEKNCAGNAPVFRLNPARPGEGAWTGWSPTITNSRFQDAKAAGLAATGVPRLKLKWAFNLGPVTRRAASPR